MTQAISIPTSPAIIPAATYIRPETVATYSDMESLPYPLQAMETVMVFIDWTGNITHLNGPLAGREGVRFYENLQGEQHLWFEQVTVEGAYMLGGIIDRVNYLIRKINFRVFIGAPGMNNITYRMSEDRWWTGQDEVQGGWFGVFTRYSGWRWIQVFPEKTVDTTQKRDPVAYDNNCAIWDVNWIAVIPNYAKPSVSSDPWIASNGSLQSDGYYHGTIAIPNLGDMQGQVRYLVTGENSGNCQVQDNNSTTMVALPEIYTSDGDVLVDTDPVHKTLIAANDPADDEYYAVTSAANLLTFMLSGSTTDQHEAYWLRGYVRFLYTTPPKSVVHLHVMHTNPNAQIVAQMPQRYKRSR